MNILPVYNKKIDYQSRYPIVYPDWGLLIEKNISHSKEGLFKQEVGNKGGAYENKEWYEQLYIENGDQTSLSVNTQNQIITTTQGIYSAKQGISHPVIKNLVIIISLANIPRETVSEKNFFQNLQQQFQNALPQNKKNTLIYTKEEVEKFNDVKGRVINELRAERFIMDLRHLGGVRFCSARNLNIQFHDIACRIAIDELSILSDAPSIKDREFKVASDDKKTLTRWEKFSAIAMEGKAWIDAGIDIANLTLNAITEINTSIQNVAGSIQAYSTKINNIVAQSANIANPINILTNSINSLKNSIKSIQTIPSNLSNSFISSFESLGNLFNQSRENNSILPAPQQRVSNDALKTGTFKMVSTDNFTEIANSPNLFSQDPVIQKTQEAICMASLISQTAFVMATTEDIQYETQDDMLFLDNVVKNVTLIIDGFRKGMIFTNLNEYKKPVYKNILQTDYRPVMIFYEGLYADFIQFAFQTKREFVGLKSKKYIKGTTLEMVAQDIYKKQLDNEIYDLLKSLNKLENSFDLPETIFYKNL